jgi:hypothetical protein
MLPLIGNLAYGLMLCAFVTRDLLYLRAVLIAGQSLAILYAWGNGVPIIAAWNVLFVAVNAWMAYLLVQDRLAVRVPEDVRPTYERHFAPLTPQEFLRFWNSGEPETADAGWLVRAGERPAWLYFLTEGRVRVSRETETITELGAGYFVGEMSLLTGRAANADVAPVGRVEARRWSTSALLDARERDPRLWTKIQSVIGLDLVEKVHLAEQRGA